MAMMEFGLGLFPTEPPRSIVEMTKLAEDFVVGVAQQFLKYRYHYRRSYLIVRLIDPGSGNLVRISAVCLFYPIER